MEICGCDQSLALQKEVDKLKEEIESQDIRLDYWAYRCGYAEGVTPLIDKDKRHEIARKAIIRIRENKTSTKDKTNETT